MYTVTYIMYIVLYEVVTLDLFILHADNLSSSKSRAYLIHTGDRYLQ